MDPSTWYDSQTQQYYPYGHLPPNPSTIAASAPAPAPAPVSSQAYEAPHIAGDVVQPPGVDAVHVYAPHGGYDGHAVPFVYSGAGARTYYHGYARGGAAQSVLAEEASRKYGVHPNAHGDRFESDATAVLEAHSKVKKHIEELESKLRNCLQEIDFLQDQLNLRSVEVNCLGEHVHSLELKLAEVNKLHEKMRLLKDEVLQSDFRCMFLVHELEQKETELRESNLYIEKLETVISSVSLESQCELESMKLDISSLERRCFEAEKSCEQAAQEKTRMDSLLEEYSVRFNDAQQDMKSLEMENKELQEKLRKSEESTKLLVCKAQHHLKEWMKSNCRTAMCVPSEPNKHLLMKMGNDCPPNEMCTYKEVLEPFLSKLAVVTAWDENVTDEMEKMSNQIQESDRLISQLKEELREEKLRAKEEAEDLAQEMAELRYQITGMLEEECNRRACIEQASIRRIQELEAQVLKEQRKSLAVTKHFHEARDQAEARTREVQHLKNALKTFIPKTEPETSVSMELCSCGSCVFVR